MAHNMHICMCACIVGTTRATRCLTDRCSLFQFPQGVQKGQYELIVSSKIRVCI